MTTEKDLSREMVLADIIRERDAQLLDLARDRDALHARIAEMTKRIEEIEVRFPTNHESPIMSHGG